MTAPVIAAALVTILASAVVPVQGGQGAAAQPQATPPAGTATTAPTPSPAPATSALEPQGYTYNPEGRRDPFVSLVRRGREVPGSSPATRPAGLAGLSVSEVSLRGTVKGRDGFVAMLQGVDNKTYLARPGDKLLDGTVRTIAADSIVLLQRVSDPLSADTTREVRKMLRQTEEAK
jgi:type IV pilus assembly protein PilP